MGRPKGRGVYRPSPGIHIPDDRGYPAAPELIYGGPLINRGEPPMTPAQTTGFQSLLQGRVVGSIAILRNLQEKEVVNIAGPISSGMAMGLTLCPGASALPFAVASKNAYYKVFGPAVYRITWGGGGASNYVEVDGGRGCVIPLFGSNLSVIVKREQNAGATQEEAWGAFVSHYTTAPRQIVTRTLRSDPGEVIAAAATLAGLVLPPYTKSVQVFCLPSTAAFTVGVESQAAPIMSLPIGAGQAMDPVNLPNDAASITLTNDSAADITSYRVVCGLAL